MTLPRHRLPLLETAELLALADVEPVLREDDAALDELLFDVRTGRGRLVMFNPMKIRLRSGLKLIALGRTVADAQRLVDGEVRERLQMLVRTRRHTP